MADKEQNEQQEGKQHQHKYAGALMLLLGMSFFGSATPVSKLVGKEFEPILATAVRMLLAGLALLPFALWREKGLLKLGKKDWLLVAGVAVIGNIGFTMLMLYGMKMVSGVTGSIIMSLTPAVTATGAVLFLGEKMNKRKIFALGLGVAGVLVMQLSSGKSDSGNNVLLGSLLVFAAICCEATYTLMGKVATDDMTPLKLATLSALGAGLLLLPWVFIEAPKVDWQGIDTKPLLSLLWYGLGTMALGSVLWYSGVKKVPGHVAAAFMVVMPVSAIVLSYVLLGEQFQWVHLLGFALAFAGVFLMVRQHQKG